MRTETDISEPRTDQREPSRAVEFWTTFTWIYLVFAGVLNVIYGIAALRNRGYFHESDLLWANLSSWGWLAIAIGALQILIALKVRERTMGGAIAGMAIAVCAFIANFLSIGAYPAWSIIAMVVNGFVIWALPRSVVPNR